MAERLNPPVQSVSWRTLGSFWLERRFETEFAAAELFHHLLSLPVQLQSRALLRRLKLHFRLLLRQLLNRLEPWSPTWVSVHCSDRLSYSGLQPLWKVGEPFFFLCFFNGPNSDWLSALQRPRKTKDLAASPFSVTEFAASQWQLLLIEKQLQ